MSERNESDNENRLSEETKSYGLEDRTFAFAQDVRAFVRTLPRTLSNVEDARQLVRSSGSVGANFIEAVESLSPKDFAFRLRISRKEAKESRYWLRLLHLEDTTQKTHREMLIEESHQLMLILNAMIRKHSAQAQESARL